MKKKIGIIILTLLGSLLCCSTVYANSLDIKKYNVSRTTISIKMVDGSIKPISTKMIDTNIKTLSTKTINTSAKKNNVNENPDVTKAREAKPSVTTLDDFIALSGQSMKKMFCYAEEKGIILRQMTEGKLDYSMKVKMDGVISTICLEVEHDNERIQEIYIKPQQAKVSEWIHRFNQKFGPCIEIEKNKETGDQVISYLTWMTENRYVSLVKLNESMYIYITSCE